MKEEKTLYVTPEEFADINSIIYDAGMFDVMKAKDIIWKRFNLKPDTQYRVVVK